MNISIEDLIKSALNYVLTDLRGYAIRYDYQELLNEAIDIAKKLRVPRREDIAKNFVSAYLRLKLNLPASVVDKFASSSRGRRLWEEKIKPILEEIEKEKKEREELMNKIKSNYYEALKRAWNKYWGRFPPWYAPLENLAPLIEEELSKIIGKSIKLSFEEHVKIVEQLFKWRRIKEFYIGGIDPKKRHWILL